MSLQVLVYTAYRTAIITILKNQKKPTTPLQMAGPHSDD